MNNATSIVREAVEATRRALGDYWQKTCAQRSSVGGAGSVIEGTPDEVEQLVLGAEWEEYSHPAVMAGCKAFKADIPGQLGIVDLDSLADDSQVTLDDRKGTGMVSAVMRDVRGKVVNFTVVIVGNHEGDEVVFTFHPGDPVLPSQVQATPGLHGSVVTVAEAQAMGLTTAKIA